MRWQEKQDQVEKAVYEAIDELEDEIGVLVPYYPTVIWVGRTMKFSDTGLTNRKEAVFNMTQIAKESCLFPPSTILLFTDDMETIREESSHFVHLSVSKINLHRCSLQENICVRILAEMLGLLGAKILGPTKRSNHNIVPDLAYLDEDDWQAICDACPDYFQSDMDFFKFYAYQQGYGLAERIFCQYIFGNISQKFIRDLFLNPLKNQFSASRKFRRLKKQFWPRQLPQATKS